MSNRKRTTMGWFGCRIPRNAENAHASRPKTTVLRVECLEARMALSGLNLAFQIENPNYNASNVYVSFFGGSLNATYDGGTPVALNHSYSISELKGPIHIVSYTGGRVFVSLGDGVSGMGEPEMVNPSIPSYKVRHDKIELTFNDADPNSVANLTAVDYFAIPLKINTYQSGSATPVDKLTYRISANALTTSLAALAGNSSEVLQKYNGNFLRVLSPHTTTLSGVSHYLSMKPYIDAVKTWQTQGTPIHNHTTIEDIYSRNGSTPAQQTQRYYFQATVMPDGSLKMIGGGEKIGGGRWPGANHTILISAANLLKGIYLGNVPWTVDGNADSFAKNDVYGAAVRDVLAGFNLGFMASETKDPNTGIPFGQESSKYWWHSPRAFEFLQPKHIFYNQYAQIVTGHSDAYSWAFSDRWSHVQANLHGMETLEVVVMADTASAQTLAELQPTTEDAILGWAANSVEAAAVAQLLQVQFVFGGLTGSLTGQIGMNLLGSSNSLIHTSSTVGFATPISGMRPTMPFDDLWNLNPKAVDQIDFSTVVENDLGLTGLGDLNSRFQNIFSGEMGISVRRRIRGK